MVSTSIARLYSHSAALFAFGDTSHKKVSDVLTSFNDLLRSRPYMVSPDFEVASAFPADVFIASVALLQALDIDHISTDVIGKSGVKRRSRSAVLTSACNSWAPTFLDSVEYLSDSLPSTLSGVQAASHLFYVAPTAYRQVIAPQWITTLLEMIDPEEQKDDVELVFERWNPIILDPKNEFITLISEATEADPRIVKWVLSTIKLAIALPSFQAGSVADLSTGVPAESWLPQALYRMARGIVDRMTGPALKNGVLSTQTPVFITGGPADYSLLRRKSRISYVPLLVQRTLDPKKVAIEEKALDDLLKVLERLSNATRKTDAQAKNRTNANEGYIINVNEGDSGNSYDLGFSVDPSDFLPDLESDRPKNGNKRRVPKSQPKGRTMPKTPKVTRRVPSPVLNVANSTRGASKLWKLPFKFSFNPMAAVPSFIIQNEFRDYSGKGLL